MTQQKIKEIFKDNQEWSEDKLEYVLLQSDFSSISKKLTNLLDNWISVKTRLPKEDGWYMVVTKWVGYYNRNPMEFYFTKDNKWHWYNHSFGEWKSKQTDLIIHGNHVTHWQPLPQPPKED